MDPPAEDPADRINRSILAPLVLAMSALAWGEALIEALSRGAIHPRDPLTDLYLTLLGGYIGGIEVRKWVQKEPPNPAQDPWLERAQRAGFLVFLWWGLYIAVHLWQFHDATVVMPGELKPITKAVILLLIGKHVSRYVRHTRRGVGGSGSSGTADEDAARADADSSAQAELVEVLSAAPEGLTFQEIEAALPETSRSHIARLLKGLLHEGRIERQGVPRSRLARYIFRRGSSV